MRRSLRPLLPILALVAATGCASTAAVAPGRDPAQSADDPHLWLENIDSTAALDWVRARNASTLTELKADPRFATNERALRRSLLAPDRIPDVGWAAGRLRNFWQDAVHVRGIWRETTPAGYASGATPWRTLLDLDRLAATERENWVWKGARCLAPEFRRCLVSLSRGGGDAVVVREFDAATGAFPPDGFAIPEAKTRAVWADADTLIVGTARGAGSLTRSGYPRTLAAWRRGTPLSGARVIFEAAVDDVGAFPLAFDEPVGERGVRRTLLLNRARNFYSNQYSRLVLGRSGDDGPPTYSVTALPAIPDDAELQVVHRGSAILSLRAPWSTASGLLPAGAIATLDLADAVVPPAPGAAAPGRAKAVYVPEPRVAVREVAVSGDRLLLGLLRNVSGELLEFNIDAAGAVTRRRVPLLGAGEIGTASLMATSPFTPEWYATYEGFLVSPRVLASSRGGPPHVVRRLPERFDARRLDVRQLEAVSRDGTRIPYFVVRPRGAAPTGGFPTLLYGYGGFEVPVLPSYLSAAGPTWLAHGGMYVVANIRGGGEFGPAWHQAGLRGNRQRVFDDFLAVAEDLERRQLTSPAKLGILGGSNGGLLTGAAFVQRPELFGAVVAEVPLLDMLRYHRLLAGASWVSEYGNPDLGADRASILRWSPYQNLRKDGRYPRPLIITSTRDDRVHPGHARKFAARLLEYGKPVLFFENIEGGHGGAANLEQKVQMKTIEFTYLMAQLMAPDP